LALFLVSLGNEDDVAVKEAVNNAPNEEVPLHGSSKPEE
jgi:hypothetical protein